MDLLVIEQTYTFSSIHLDQTQLIPFNWLYVILAENITFFIDLDKIIESISNRKDIHCVISTLRSNPINSIQSMKGVLGRECHQMIYRTIWSFVNRHIIRHIVCHQYMWIKPDQFHPDDCKWYRQIIVCKVENYMSDQMILYMELDNMIGSVGNKKKTYRYTRSNPINAIQLNIGDLGREYHQMILFAIRQCDW